MSRYVTSSAQHPRSDSCQSSKPARLPARRRSTRCRRARRRAAACAARGRRPRADRSKRRPQLRLGPARLGRRARRGGRARGGAASAGARSRPRTAWRRCRRVPSPTAAGGRPRRSPRTTRGAGRGSPARCRPRRAWSGRARARGGRPAVAPRSSIRIVNPTSSSAAVDGVDRRRLDAEAGEHVAVDAHLGRVHLGREVEAGEVALQEHRGRAGRRRRPARRSGAAAAGWPSPRCRRAPRRSVTVDVRDGGPRAAPSAARRRADGPRRSVTAQPSKWLLVPPRVEGGQVAGNGRAGTRPAASP